MTGTRATIPQTAALSEDEAFAVMVHAFTQGLIERGDRTPILRMFGEADLVFCLRLGEAGEQDAAEAGGAAGEVLLEARGTAIHLSVAVQRRLKAYFADWLSAN